MVRAILIGLLAIFLLIVAGIIYLIFHPIEKIGDIKPAIIPVSTPSKAILENQADSPLKLNSQFKLQVFAQNLGNPRDLVFSPAGTLLVSIPGSGKIIALPDKNNDNASDQTKVILAGLNGPHGLAFFGGKLFVAEKDKLIRYNWDEANLTATKDKFLFNLPPVGLHVTRSLVFDDKGTMYISVGSTCNVCVEKDPENASILISDSDGKIPQVFAKGLRNSVFMTLNPNTKDLWATDMGRDSLGDNIPPDEINIIHQGADYGWPYCYSDKIHDTNFDPKGDSNRCQNTLPPTYKICAHCAPLGLTFINSNKFPPDWQGDLLVSLHGSWNRSVPDGYKVVHLKVQGNSVTSQEDFLTGFINGSTAFSRPVDLVFDSQGKLYLSDDKGGNIYLITKK